MPHLRARHALKLFLKKVKFSAVVTLNGARQCGKSFFIRELFAKHAQDKRAYITLDSLNMRELAEKNPAVFLEKRPKSGTLCVDEAQRAPNLFEAVKESADNNKTPGQFVLLGSTEFSHRTRIRESLTGRASNLHLFPFTISEILGLEPSPTPLEFPLSQKSRASRAEVVKFLERGGLPGVFSVRNDAEREALWNDWVNLTCERDIYQIQGFEPDARFAARIVQIVANQSDATVSAIAKITKTSLIKTRHHVEALRALFVLTEVSPFSSAKPVFTLFDAGVANLFASPFDVRLRIWATHELFAKRALGGMIFPRIDRYQGAKGALIDFVIVGQSGTPVTAIKIFPFEKLSIDDFAVMRAFAARYPRCRVVGLGPERVEKTVYGFEVYPWEALI